MDILFYCYSIWYIVSYNIHTHTHTILSIIYYIYSDQNIRKILHNIDIENIPCYYSR